ncbi:hypothetical protein MtrunA17_Chr5g0448391 [Medicago truncatula]|uniref:Transmembrane protein n=1 Tax=Medicago truncatula TaxID=3880 RepID=A0A396HXV0_MEDTR|nr:hypothetical protein MtrunA17_Chr5g0448391 [Medicago truncatula]
MSPPSHLLLAPPLHLHDLSLLLETQSLSRPTERPPPYVKQILHFGLPDLPSPSILKLVSASYPPSLPSLVWPPRKPPEEFRTTLKVVLLRGLRFNRLPPKPPWMLCWSAALSMACLVLLFFDKVNKSETMCSRNVRDEAEEMIRNWIEKKTLNSHISFVSIRRWKLLMNELLAYGIWFKFSYLYSKFRCTQILF